MQQENLDKLRCVIHIDLDCFYCQVEHARLGIPVSQPLAVQQWNVLIAVNYAARAAGIQRQCPVDKALLQCPDLHLVHVATYAPDGSAAYRESPSRDTHKVCLDPYRHASSQVLEILRRHADIVEKASIDEAYLDIAPQVLSNLTSTLTWPSGTIVLGDEGEDTKENLTMLRGGSHIAARIRADVFAELGYTCSVGVAGNKLLAKLCSANNKPDKLSVLLANGVRAFMQGLPVGKIRSLGGKLGHEVRNALGGEYVGDLLKYGWGEWKCRLSHLFSEDTIRHVYNICHGIDHDPVSNPRNRYKFIMTAKSFPKKLSLADVSGQWVKILVCDLLHRLNDNCLVYECWPRTLQVQARLEGYQNMVSKSTNMLSYLQCQSSPNLLISKVNNLIPRIQTLKENSRLTRLAISASNFQPLVLTPNSLNHRSSSILPYLFRTRKSNKSNVIKRRLSADDKSDSESKGEKYKECEKPAPDSEKPNHEGFHSAQKLNAELKNLDTSVIGRNTQVGLLKYFKLSHK